MTDSLTSDPDRYDERILVTGSTGYLGRYVVERLRTTGHSFSELNVLSRRGKLSWLSSNCSNQGVPAVSLGSGHALNGNALPEPIDLRDLAGVQHRLSELRPTVILHLAGETGRRGVADSVQINCDTVNVAGTRNLLEVAGRIGVRRVVSIGSAAEYGLRMTAEPLDVTALCRPTTQYGRSKLQQTEVVFEQSRRWGFAACVLRVFNLFGPDQPSGTLIPDLLTRISAAAVNSIARWKLSRAGDVRDFVPVEIVARVIVELATRRELIGIQHASTGEGHTVGEVAHWLSDEFCRLCSSSWSEQRWIDGLLWQFAESDREPTYSIGVPSPIIKEVVSAWPLDIEQEIRAVANRAARQKPASDCCDG